MTRLHLPTPYELAGIAAALGREAVKKPAQAAKDAFELWMACRAEIDARANAISRDDNSVPPPKDPDDERLFIEERDGTKVTYPALEWIQKNAKEPRDQFKKIKAFKTAWREFENSGQIAVYEPQVDLESQAVYVVPPSIRDLRAFLAWRKNERREGDAARKRTKRDPGGAVAKSASTKNAENVAGHASKSERKNR